MVEDRATYGASLSPDATAFAHIVDDGGYPRAVQRFLRGWRASSSRDVELPVDGPVTRIIHSADGHWLACQVAPGGGNRSQIWVVTTDPDDRAARRIDPAENGTAELIGWDGTLVAVTVTGEDGVGHSCLIDPATRDTTVLDRRSGGHLVDAWAGSALIRIGPRGYRELNLLRGSTEIGLLPWDPGSTTDAGVILDDHAVRRIKHADGGNTWRFYRPSRSYGFGSAEGYVRAMVRSDNGCEYARLLEVTVSQDGVSYHVVAERPDCDLDEFAVSDDLSTVALLWNRHGYSELQILELIDETLEDPIPLPGLVASELSISAGGSMIALTVQAPGQPRTVELVDPRSRTWEPIERAPNRFAGSSHPSLVTIEARDGTVLHSWLYEPIDRTDRAGALVYLHGGPEGQERPGYSELFPPLLAAGITVLAPNVRGSGGFGKTFVHADDKERRFAAIDDVADCVQFLIDNSYADAHRIGCAGWSYGGYLTLAALTFHPNLFAAGVSICGMSDLENFYHHTEPWIAAAAYPKYGHPIHDRALLEQLSPLRRISSLSAPLLVVHGAHDTNVPVNESEQLVAAVRDLGGIVDYIMFPDEGHHIVKPSNRAKLSAAVTDWLSAAFE
ncbi:alpha/beta fold hydrolase [Antrihabitans stalactiti]|uniref:S9 family peptidase n=1 Tax=Antrihabitans stalactiti TaxID=2584121 RepID=A0A848KNV1_9NOCA|nr:S9 family peptidase [Antrihabitans stalactiti]